jgi:hypothetical protein
MFELLKTALIVAGVLHFTLLSVGLAMPRVLRWEQDLRKVDPFSRQVILVHGAFIVLTIIGFGVITLVGADALLRGGVLAAAVAGFIGLFWLARFLIALFYFRPGKWLSTSFLKLGYAALFFVFGYFSLVYLAVACLAVGRAS